MSISAHIDTFGHDHLPPRREWPDLVFALPELQYPEQINCATELLDQQVTGRSPRPQPSSVGVLAQPPAVTQSSQSSKVIS